MRAAARELGRRGGLKGGKARSEKMTPEERTRRAPGTLPGLDGSLTPSNLGVTIMNVVRLRRGVWDVL